MAAMVKIILSILTMFDILNGYYNDMKLMMLKIATFTFKMKMENTESSNKFP